ncbi:MAG: MBL fold metallo-hydrolase [Dehalococcoidia bacterium]|nr:MBL fold metallo-hydrolase [Dehalococcoidia bacterium]
MESDPRTSERLERCGSRVMMDPFGRPAKIYEVAPGIALVSGFGLSIGIQTGDGLVVVDTSGRNHGEAVVAAMRTWDETPVRNVVYTHGHFDHVGGMGAYDADALQRGYPRPHVFAHENLPLRLERYAQTAGYNATVNARQFLSRPVAPPQMVENFAGARMPDETYRDSHAFEQGGVRFELRHGKGETDDHTWCGSLAKAICAGDFSSGAARTPATRRRPSATRPNGRRLSGRWLPSGRKSSSQPRHADFRKRPHPAGADRDG